MRTLPNESHNTIARLWAHKEILFVLLSIVIALGAWLYPRRVDAARQMQVDVLANAPLVSGLPHNNSDWRITYKDRPVASPHQTILRFTNTGDAPILSSDIATPITISWSNGNLIHHAILEVSPKDLQIEPSVSGRCIRINTGLLNSGNSFVYMFITDDAPGLMEYKFRAIGIDQLLIKSNEPIPPSKFFAGLGLALQILGALYVLGVALFLLYVSVGLMANKRKVT